VQLLKGHRDMQYNSTCYVSFRVEVSET
jgi:hypothetical protein